jgi:copper transport protein
MTLLGALAGPAWGHATLVSSTPAGGDTLPAAPATVGFTFSEEVTTGLGGIVVLDRNANRMDRGVTTRPAPNQVRADLRADMPAGTYLASYRVVSADGHIVTGAIVFAVGDELDAAAVEGLVATDDPLVTVASTVGNFALYAGTLTAIGLGVFMTLIHGAGPDRRRLGGGVRLAVGVAVVGAVVRVVALAAEGTGRGLGSVTEKGVLAEVLRQANTGWWLVALMVGLAVLYASTVVRAGAVAQGLVVYGVFVTAGSFALVGHTTSADNAVVLGVADAVHVAVAGIWVGGLVGVAALLRWHAGGGPTAANDVAVGRRSDAGTGDAAVVARMSTVAAGAVVVLWITGVAQAWWTVGSWSNLFDSDYGRVLLVKLVLVVATLALAGYNRWRLVPAVTNSAATGSDPRRRLRRTVMVELAVLAAAVLATSVLVDTAPARIGATGPQPFNQTLPIQAGLELNLLVTPGAVGLNEIHVTYVDQAGMLDDRVESVVIEMSLPFDGIGPIVTNGALVEPGHYLARTENLVVAGVWRIEVVSRIGQFEQRRTAFDVPISG